MRHRTLTFLILCVAAIGVISWVSGHLRAPSPPEHTTGEMSIADAVRAIDAGTATSPIVGEQPRRGKPSLTFVAKGVGTVAPRIVSDATGWGERPDGNFDTTVGVMTRVPGTDWYSLEVKVEPFSRIEYLIAYGPGDFRLDPHNPRKVQRVGGPASEVVMQGYVPPQEFVDAAPARPIPLIDEAVPSRALRATRRVITYLPPGFDRSHPYPVAVFHDGALVVNNGEAPRVLDWLIAHQAIEPIVAVFVDPVSRTDDFKRGAPMRTFVTSELFDYLSTRAVIATDPQKRAIIGISAGARGALDAASATNAFGLLGLMIPALGEDDVTAIPTSSKHKIRASILSAQYDALNVEAARSAQLTLVDQGQAVTYKEVPEGHTTATWRLHLRDVLIDLFGPQAKR